MIDFNDIKEMHLEWDRLHKECQAKYRVLKIAIKSATQYYGPFIETRLAEQYPDMKFEINADSYGQNDRNNPFEFNISLFEQHLFEDGVWRQLDTLGDHYIRCEEFPPVSIEKLDEVCKELSEEFGVPVFFERDPLWVLEDEK